MQNINATVDANGILHLEVDLNADGGTSKSGKTITVATTGGNLVIPGTDVKLGLNAYRDPRTEAEIKVCAEQRQAVQAAEAAKGQKRGQKRDQPTMTITNVGTTRAA